MIRRFFGFFAFGLFVLAAAPVARGEAPEILGEVVLVRGGTEQRARSVLTHVESERAALARVLTLPPGYPRIVSHREIPDLDEGIYAVALGVCSVEGSELAEVKGIAKVFFPDARAERTTASVSCPTRVTGWRLKVATGWRVKDAISSDARGGWFSGALLERERNGVSEQMFAMYVRQEHEGLPLGLSDSMATVFLDGCSGKLSTDLDVIRVERTCAAPAPAGTEVLRFRVENGKIAEAPGLAPADDVQAVVWGGGATRDAAQAALARWTREKAALPEELVTLAPGYPKIVKSEDYPGLPPGQQLVLLGVCPAKRLPAPLWRLKAFDGRVSAQRVKAPGGEPACPTLAQATEGDRLAVARVGGRTLQVVQYGKTHWSIVAYLRDGNGELVDWKRDDESTRAAHGGHCTWVDDLAAVGGKGGAPATGIRADLSCGAPMDDTNFSYKVNVTYGVAGDKITASVKASKAPPGYE